MRLVDEFIPPADPRSIFHKSRTPLTKWFLAIYLVTQSKNDIAALELARQLGVKWDTAWLIKQKLMETMRQRNRTYKLKGEVQLDDAYLGGEKPGKRGRGAANKIPFVIAVETRKDEPVYTQLRRVSGFTSEAIKTYAAQNIEPGACVASDGLACFAAVTEAGMKHRPVITGSGGLVIKTMNFFAATFELPCRLIPTRHESLFAANAYESN